ncbi:hypothetical protein P22_2753 [Propionispora sp. 2/2-37]|uniref:TrkA C-terminal domain-containing protein n=1 Tax=Propionispora sp. 2/2-37 TaxID=1677858 RepID=UPI0006BB6E0E|nr:TrkA C-terminal domain-containing protein [Propionispora sp. 2/2-37]CUH96663.1 hypothetical protein P22_2753 [Propionispora sp. 2/2-37]
MQPHIVQHDLKKGCLLQKLDHTGAFPIDVAEIPVCAESALAGQTLQQAWTKADLSLLPVAINRNNRFLFIAIHRERLHPSDTLIVIGQPSSIRELQRLATLPSQ